MKKHIALLIQSVILLLWFNGAMAQAPLFSDYASIGASHNDGLNKFFADYSPDRVRKEQLDINGLNKYIAALPSGYIQGDFSLQVLNNELYQTSRRLELSELASTYQRRGVITATCESWLQTLNNIIDRTFDAGAEALASAIEVIEKEIFAAADLKETEKGILLSATATGKSSFRFWQERYPKLLTEWGYQSPNARTTCCPTAKKIGKADVAGAVGGGVAGAVIGTAVATPVGTLPGWAVGAVTGGISSSTYEAVTRFLNWLF